MSTISYDERSFHFRLINANIAALHILDNGLIDTSTRNYANMQLIERPTCFRRGERNINAGFVGLLAENHILVVFRGTITVPPDAPPDLQEAACLDWTQDQKFNPVSWSASEPFGHVCEGFAAAAESVWNDVKYLIANLPRPKRRVISITGHSKGGAMALLLAPRIHNEFGLRNDLQDVVTFGAPCVGDNTGDDSFASNYNRYRLTPKTIRYQNQYDIIPLAPQKLPVIPDGFMRECTALHPAVLPEPRTEYAQIGKLYYISRKGLDNTSADYDIETNPIAAEAGYSQSVQGDVPPLLAMQAHPPEGNYLNCFYGTS